MTNVNQFMSDFESLVESGDWIKMVASPSQKDEIREIARNFYSQHTHLGLIWYLYYCTALSSIAPLSIVIRPDMIWFTILNEIAIYYNSNPKLFSHVFNSTKIKRKMFTKMGGGSALDINELTSKMKDSIVDKRFFQLLTQTTFESEAPLSNYSVRMLFAFMGTLNNKLLKVQSQPAKVNRNVSISVHGSKKDWITLYKSVEKLEMYGPKPPQRGGFASETDHIFVWNEYIQRCKGVVAKIIENKKKFLNEIFQNVKNPSQGHQLKEYIVDGWAKKLYMNENSDGMSISEFNTHINFVPYEKLDSSDSIPFLQIAGLVYSNIGEHSTGGNRKTTIFEPQYGIVKFATSDRLYHEISTRTPALHHQPALHQPALHQPALHQPALHQPALQHQSDLIGSSAAYAKTSPTVNNDVYDLTKFDDSFIRQPQQTHLEDNTPRSREEERKRFSSNHSHIMPMNPISTFPQARGVSDFLRDNKPTFQLSEIPPDMRHTHQLKQIPPPQSVLFELKEPDENLGKTFGGDYIKAFQRDDTIPMTGGAMPQNN